MTSGSRDAVEEHGMAMDKEKQRVQCKYCNKEVRGFNRLKHHLAGLGSDVTQCVTAPDQVKTCMRYELLQKKKDRLIKEVGQIYHPNLPLRRTSTPPANPSQPISLKRKVSAVLISDTSTLLQQSSPSVGESSHLSNVRLNSEAPEDPVSVKEEEINESSLSLSSMTDTVQASGALHLKQEVKDASVLRVARCIGKFFYEAGIDLSLLKSPSFQSMLDAAIECGPGYKIPMYEELGGWILQEELQRVRDIVEEIKLSWSQTGCSILLDGWNDQKGRSLIAFLVDCPKGTIFLRSEDASYAIHDVDSLVSLLSKVIEEVGPKHVVQVISHDTSCYMEAAGKKIAENYRTIFWTRCADYCINLMLDRIGALDHVKKVLMAAKTITKFIYSNVAPLQLMKQHIGGRDLVKTSKLRAVSSFMTLEKMVLERENLMHMFDSATWHASSWSFRSKGKAISDLVNDPVFWHAAGDVVKITAPLFGILHKINDNDVAPMGFLYDAMDRAKEEIKANMGGEGVRYLPIWTIIDDIWDNYLHSPLHSAGYYLNPSLFYSGDFYVDAEVTNGLLCCTVRMIGDLQTQELVVHQLEAYKAVVGGFADEAAVIQRDKVATASWWSMYADHCPELQELAVRILSQKCSGTARYRLRKSLSEQVQAKGRNCLEQQRFCDMEFVHNNLRLWHTATDVDPKDRISFEELNSLDDWVVDGTP